jgi:hypothetical protein
MLRLQHYETAYGIYDHDHDVDKDNPLALVMMREAEITNGPLFERIEKYKLAGVGTNFHMSLPEFLSLPREVTEFILKISLKDEEHRVDNDKKTLGTIQNMLHQRGD